MSAAAGQAKRGRPPHPCWADVQRRSPAASSGVCSHCNQDVPANTSIATAHLLCQCTAVPDERRVAFRQELDRGLFQVVRADDLPPAKRARYDG